MFMPTAMTSFSRWRGRAYFLLLFSAFLLLWTFFFHTIFVVFSVLPFPRRFLFAMAWLLCVMCAFVDSLIWHIIIIIVGWNETLFIIYARRVCAQNFPPFGPDYVCVLSVSFTHKLSPLLPPPSPPQFSVFFCAEKQSTATAINWHISSSLRRQRPSQFTHLNFIELRIVNFHLNSHHFAHDCVCVSVRARGMLCVQICLVDAV